MDTSAVIVSKDEGLWVKILHEMVQLGTHPADEPIAEWWHASKDHHRPVLAMTVGLRQGGQGHGAFAHRRFTSFSE